MDILADIIIQVNHLLIGVGIAAVGMLLYLSRRVLKNNKDVIMRDVLPIAVIILAVGGFGFLMYTETARDHKIAFGQNERWESLYEKMDDATLDSSAVKILSVFLDKYGESQPKIHPRGVSKIRSLMREDGNKAKIEMMLLPFTDVDTSFDFEKE